MLKARYGFFVRGCTETIYRDPRERYYTENEAINKIRRCTDLQFKNADILLDGQCIRKVTPEDCSVPLPEEFEIELTEAHIKILRQIKEAPVRDWYRYHPYKHGDYTWKSEPWSHDVHAMRDLEAAKYLKWDVWHNDADDGACVLTEFGKAQLAKVAVNA